jgi:Zn-finger nucleic acid-binding protein
MQRENYMDYSGVIMDVCRQDGIWLDAGEFKQIQEWLRLGGHNNPSRKKLNNKVGLAQQKNRKRAEQNHRTKMPDQSGRGLGPDPYLNLLSDLFF